MSFSRLKREFKITQKEYDQIRKESQWNGLTRALNAIFNERKPTVHKF